MSSPFIGEIRIFGGNFAPRNHAFCNGQVMSISQNQSLYAILGTTYGGDGQTTFGIPNLQSRAPMHFGQGTGLTGRNLGASGGTETVTLTSAQIPSHTHTLNVFTNAATASDPTGALPGRVRTGNIYGTAGTAQSLNGSSIGNVGGTPHNNLQPYLAVNFIIVLFGIYPTPN